MAIGVSHSDLPRCLPHPPKEVAATDHLLIDDTTVVTMNPKREVLDHASVVIAGERIAEVGAADALRLKYPGASVVPGRGKVVLPGLINCHTHLSMSLQKGTTLAVADGLYRVMWPVERALTAEDCYVGALAGAAEVRNRCQVLGKGGGYMLAPLHYVQNDTPLENVLAMYRTPRGST